MQLTLLLKYQMRERKVMRRNPMAAPPMTRYKGSFITRLGGSSAIGKCLVQDVSPSSVKLIGRHCNTSYRTKVIRKSNTRGLLTIHFITLARIKDDYTYEFGFSKSG